MYEGEFCLIVEGSNRIKRICRFNSISVNEFLEKVMSITLKQNRKKNTLFLMGPSNAGKRETVTTITEGFLSIGEIQLQSHVSGMR